LLVPNSDKVDGAISHSRKNGDVGVTAKTEDVLHVSAFEEVNEVLSDRFGHALIFCGCQHHATS
jgi:hypothetical protein